MYPLQGVLKDYAWGSRTAIAELQGRASPSAGPEAELWLGAHPSAPSLVALPTGPEPLDAVIARDPETLLGPRVTARFGARLPFLLKVLAAASPLSLQAHPSAEQARAGFAAENARGLALDARERNYRDASHKPELIAALGPFRALSGFREPAASAALFAALAVPELGGLTRALSLASPSEALRAAFSGLLALSAAEREAAVAAAGAACARHAAAGGPFAAECAMAVDLERHYPGDIGVVGALLLNLVELEPGQAIYLPAGNLHAYLWGVGVEIMASSDNVLRGGLTPKHVDAEELLRVLDFAPFPATPLEAAPTAPPGAAPQTAAPLSSAKAVGSYRTAAAEFELGRVELAGGEVSLTADGPEILLVTGGAVVVKNLSSSLELRGGQAGFLPATTGGYSVGGRGTLFRASVPVSLAVASRDSRR